MEWIWNFYIYSFIGFLLELGYARITHAKKQDRKCSLFLPLCPVYGIGAAAILALPRSVAGHPVLLYLCSAVLATLVEYALAVFYEKIWRVSFWNYRGLPGNFQGRICLPFSLIWGFLGVVLYNWVQPLVHPLVLLLPDALAFSALIVFGADFLMTSYLLRTTRSTEALRWYKPFLQRAD